MRAHKITVLMSTYNGANYIDEQIGSILNQDGVDIELVIRDDCSDDGTREKLIGIAKATENVRIILGKRRLGAARSFFELLHLPQNSDFVALADQDDVWLQNKLKNAVNFILAHSRQGAPTIYGAAVYECDKYLNKIRVRSFKPGYGIGEPVFQNSFFGNTIVIDALAESLIKSIGSPSCVTMHDWWLYLLMDVAGGEVLYDETPVTLYRQHGGNEVGISNVVKTLISYLHELVYGDQIVKILTQYDEIFFRLEGKSCKKYASFDRELGRARRSLLGRLKYVLSGNIKTRTNMRRLFIGLSFIFHGISRNTNR